MTLAPPPEHLVDAEAATALFVRAGLDVVAAHPDYVRHKPGDTCIVGYLFTTAAGAVERGYVRWCADPARAAEIEAKARTFRLTTSPIGTATRRLDRHTVLYPFPNDARLRRLRWYTTPRKLKRTLGPLAPGAAPLSGSNTTVDVLRYKPERRVVTTAQLATVTGERRRVLIRHATARRAHVLAGIAEALRAHGTSTPRPLLGLDDGHTSVDEFVDGIELRAAALGGTIDPAAVGAAIRHLHAAPIDAKVRTSLDVLRATERSLVGLGSWSTELADLAERVRDALRRTVPADDADPTFLHGDLHDTNVLVTPGGEAIFIDLERCVRGPAAIDLGRLRGTAIGIAVRRPGRADDTIAIIEEIVEHARRSHPSALGDDALAWHTATSLVDQALLAARLLEPNWRHVTYELLDLAVEQVTVRRPT